MAAWDPGGQALWIHGGFDGSACEDLWRFNTDSSTWDFMASGGPSARYNHVAAWDVVNSAMMVHGGFGRGLLGDLWRFTATSATTSVTTALFGASTTYSTSKTLTSPTFTTTSMTMSSSTTSSTTAGNFNILAPATSDSSATAWAVVVTLVCIILVGGCLLCAYLPRYTSRSSVTPLPPPLPETSETTIFPTNTQTLRPLPPPQPPPPNPPAPSLPEIPLGLKDLQALATKTSLILPISRVGEGLQTNPASAMLQVESKTADGPRAKLPSETQFAPRLRQAHPVAQPYQEPELTVPSEARLRQAHTCYAPEVVSEPLCRPRTPQPTATAPALSQSCAWPIDLPGRSRTRPIEPMEESEKRRQHQELPHLPGPQPFGRAALPDRPVAPSMVEVQRAEPDGPFEITISVADLATPWPEDSITVHIGPVEASSPSRTGILLDSGPCVLSPRRPRSTSPPQAPRHLRDSRRAHSVGAPQTPKPGGRPASPPGWPGRSISPGGPKHPGDRPGGPGRSASPPAGSGSPISPRGPKHPVDEPAGPGRSAGRSISPGGPKHPSDGPGGPGRSISPGGPARPVRSASPPGGPGRSISPGGPQHPGDRPARPGRSASPPGGQGRSASPPGGQGRSASPPGGQGRSASPPGGPGRSVSPAGAMRPEPPSDGSVPVPSFRRSRSQSEQPKIMRSRSQGLQTSTLGGPWHKIGGQRYEWAVLNDNPGPGAYDWEYPKVRGRIPGLVPGFPHRRRDQAKRI